MSKKIQSRSHKISSPASTKGIRHPKRLHTPHDKLFKNFLKDITIAQNFFEIHLPEAIKPYCDLSTLRISDTSYVEAAYESNLSDVLYQLDIQGETGYLYCLIEHVSEASVWTPFQILKYQVSILQQHLSQLPKAERKQAKLPIVIPLIFYRGEKSPYPQSTDVMECFQQPELARKIFLRPLPLIDLSVIPDEELKTHQSIALMELIQKHIYTRDKLEYKTREWIENDRLHTYLTLDQFAMVIQYELHLNRPNDFHEFMRVIEQADIEREYIETMQTVAQHLREEGMQQGMQAGMQQGMQAGIYKEKHENAKRMLMMGLDETMIQEVTGLSKEEIEAL
jgi:predicted transposase/invertase (TIGR01784 family)